MSGSIDVFSSRILVVDDQESNVRLLTYALRREGYLAVTCTTEPLEVCALHREHQFDLILLDLQMPRMNGFAVMTALASEKRVPVLILSADPSQMVQALEAGAADFLSKPFVLGEVLLVVRVLLEKAASALLVA